jgi:DNA excision repair protein ERCC-2
MLSFPFSRLREGQQKIIESVQRSISNGKNLMINAPTGMGKTAAVLYGALKAMEGSDTRLVFLTAKHTHQNIVYETMNKINSISGRNIKYTGINGKRSMCLFDNQVEPSVFIEFCRAVREQDMCNFYSNTFSRKRDVKPRVLEALEEGFTDPASAIEVARKYSLCPYELSLLNAKNSKVLVANYSHIFDDEISASFIAKAGLDPKKTILIIDEAHNLPEKVIEMNSFSISVRTLERAYKEATDYGFPGLASKIQKIISEANSSDEPRTVDFSPIFSIGDLDDVSEIIKAAETANRIPASVTLKKFISVALKADESYIQYIFTEDGHKKININALDPSEYSRSTFSSFMSSVLISGTLHPMDMFANLLGLGNLEKLDVESGFSDGNRLLLNETDVTSKFSNRSLQYSNIASRVDDLLDNLPYNMIIFFPSYSFMESVFALLPKKDRIIKERPRITREEKLEILKDLSKPGKALFAVIGGNFSESVGLKDNIIKLIAVVGVPYEPPSIKLKAMQIYYEKKFGNGFEYAQVLPSMIKVMQAAGRGIRSSSDKAAIIFMDSRYRDEILRKYLPQGILEVDGSPIGVIRERGFG